MSEKIRNLRDLPKIDEVLEHPEIQALEGPRWAVVAAVRAAVAHRRHLLLGGQTAVLAISAKEVGELVRRQLAPSLVSVVNGTGVVLHTNLGRAPVAEYAAKRAAAMAAAYSNLEYDLDRGRRGSRHSHVTQLLRQLTGAEDAVVVNNNAGAVLLALAALCSERECVVSRGELVEIGGSFRVPEVMTLSGARLVEVGTTNKTRIEDYVRAIGPDTGVLLSVHQSNFAIVGFTQCTSLVDLVDAAKKHRVYSMVDLGSGALIDGLKFAEWGLPNEPDVRRVVATGIDLCTFSGDKLLGGPQAGILVGKAEVISLVRSHPMMRALRPDKSTLAGLAATLELYRDGKEQDIPIVSMLSAQPKELERLARELFEAIGPLRSLSLEVVPCKSAVGGGAMPLGHMPSSALSIAAKKDSVSANNLEERFRKGPTAIIGRIANERFLLDVRTLFDESQRHAVVKAVRRVDGEMC